MEGGASSTDRRENFLETSVVSSLLDVLCSLKGCHVEMQFRRFGPFGGFLQRLIASMPTRSHNLDMLIILGKQPFLSKPIDIVSDNYIIYPSVMF